MSRIGIVTTTERVDDVTGKGLDVVVDPGGGDATRVAHFASPGDDSVPLPGDYAALEESSGTGAEHCTGYADTRNVGVALAGEKRLYARKSDGSIVGDFWIKGDGTIVASNAGGTLTLRTDGTLVVGGAGDAAALASVVDAILKAIAASVPAPITSTDAGEAGLVTIKSALAHYLTSASRHLRVNA